MAGAGDAGFKFKFNLAAREEFQEVLHDAINETFRDQVVPDAKRGSPVDTGYNRGTIDYSMAKTLRGWLARLFTQSGYGGYLEVGTYKMKAQPYLFPAVKRHVTQITDFMRLAIGLKNAGTK